MIHKSLLHKAEKDLLKVAMTLLSIKHIIRGNLSNIPLNTVTLVRSGLRDVSLASCPPSSRLAASSDIITTSEDLPEDPEKL